MVKCTPSRATQKNEGTEKEGWQMGVDSTNGNTSANHQIKSSDDPGKYPRGPCQPFRLGGHTRSKTVEASWRSRPVGIALFGKELSRASSGKATFQQQNGSARKNPRMERKRTGEKGDGIRRKGKESRTNGKGGSEGTKAQSTTWTDLITCERRWDQKRMKWPFTCLSRE